MGNIIFVPVGYLVFYNSLMKSDDPRLAYIPFLYTKYGFRRNSSNDL